LCPELRGASSHPPCLRPMRWMLVPQRVVVNGDAVAATANPLARDITNAGVCLGRVDTQHRTNPSCFDPKVSSEACWCVVEFEFGHVQLHNRSKHHPLYVHRAGGQEVPVAMNGGTTTMNDGDTVWLVRSHAAVLSRRRLESWVRAKVH
jgi:hypothetical protein